MAARGCFRIRASGLSLLGHLYVEHELDDRLSRVFFVYSSRLASCLEVSEHATKKPHLALH